MSKIAPFPWDGRHNVYPNRNWNDHYVWLVWSNAFLRPWNVINAGIAAMIAGAVAAVLCRPDLKSNTLEGGGLFLAIYTIFLLGLK